MADTGLKIVLDQAQFERAVDKALDLLELVRSDGPNNAVAIAALLITAGALVGINAEACDELSEAIWNELRSPDGKHLFQTGYRTMLQVRTERRQN